MMRFSPLSAAIVALIALVPCIAAESVDFDRDVRPILSDNCYHCHGPDEKARKADLRLDLREGLFADRGGYAPVVPGSAAKGKLYRRISTHSDDRMPPPETGLSLTRDEIDTIRSWIEAGAKWKNHWSFDPPQTTDLPSVEGENWPRNEIDFFVLARLEAAGLTPSPAADRRTLIRRVTLDLTGLPPSPDEVQAFVLDNSTDAYEKVVDRLLASPHYGERMAWEWLDAARYADTDGFQGDPTRQMWPWRDWLVAALNDNMPFDQFTVEMLAGDLLPDATHEQILASGFNRNHMYNGEGGRIAEETRVENVFDRTETTSTVWLGMTMTCARCHDHKYDPISQREYYQLYDFFNQTSEDGRGRSGKAPPVLDYLPPKNRQQLESLNRQIDVRQQKLNAPDPEVDAAQHAWQQRIASQLQGLGDATGNSTLGNWYVVGPFPAPGGDVARAFNEDLGPERGIELHKAFRDPLEWRRAKEYVDGKVHYLENTVGATYLYRTIDAPGKREMQVSLGSDDGIRVWLNGEELLANDVHRIAAPDQEKLALKLRSGENDLLLKIVNRDGASAFYFRKVTETIAGLPDDIAAALATPAESRSREQQSALRQHFRRKVWVPGQRLWQETAKLKEQRDVIVESAAKVMVMDHVAEEKRRTTHVLDRGTYNKPREDLDAVFANTPSFLPPLATDQPPDRLDLADWLVSGTNPLTARVIVNRYWQTFFGRGLVKTSEDFGRQGSRPLHPQLLDWLATQFVQSDWDVKAVHKLIVTCATYRQSSQISPESAQFDPENLLLSRAPRFRMASWMLRDQALAVSGLLVEKLGGPPVRPYQPEGIWAEATFGKIRYQRDEGDKLYRRSLYTFWRRIVGPTMFFDGGKRQTCEVKPTITNTPLHALTTLNETTFVEAARTMAQRVLLSDADTPAERLESAFKLATSRPPRPAELEKLVHRVESLIVEFADHPHDAHALLAVGDSPRDETLDVSEHAAYTVLCGLLLNLDEVLTRE